jgi:ankyrin repeat protein
MPKNRDIVRKEPDEIERRRDSLVQRSVDYLKEFDEQGLANVEELDLEGWDLHRAARIPRARDIARALIARGDDVDALDDAKYTPLHWATYRNNIYVTQLLVDHGANINVKTPGTNSWNGWSPLRFAVTGPNRLAQAAIARLLILHGAEVDSRDVEVPMSTRGQRPTPNVIRANLISASGRHCR